MLMKQLTGGTVGSAITISEGITNLSSVTVDANHKYAYVSLSRGSAPSLSLNGVTVTPTSQQSGYLYIYIIPDVKTGDVITCGYGLGCLTYID